MLEEELRNLEEELNDVNSNLAQIEDENRSLKKQVERGSRPTVELKKNDLEELENLRDQADRVLEEIAHKIKTGSVRPDNSPDKDNTFI